MRRPSRGRGCIELLEYKSLKITNKHNKTDYIIYNNSFIDPSLV